MKKTHSSFDVEFVLGAELSKVPRQTIIGLVVHASQFFDFGTPLDKLQLDLLHLGVVVQGESSKLDDGPGAGEIRNRHVQQTGSE